MKNKLLLTAALTVAATGGCHSTPHNKQAESPADVGVDCSAMIRGRFKDIMLNPGDPHYTEIKQLDDDIKKDLKNACERYRELTGHHFGME